MEIVQLVGLGLIATFLALVVKEKQPVFALMLTMFAGALIFLFLMDEITAMIELIQQLAENADIHMVYLQTILKMIGIAYITEFGAQISRDAGQGVIATKIELAGKIFILVLAIPIIKAVIEMILALLPT
ncbi:stage III sporulation protein AD [Shouchella lonarensis]|uniref:stage III sporulation protein AD n=1 Tax=Shouchella lonarensis TaxID=1464122 RepID=UPI001FE08667|nr:stage III sporulation protein AD [Shouchella lonarensis]